ncbi:MAG: hypothetical protein AAB401_06245 [Acidobacteriota bacterium]
MNEKARGEGFFAKTETHAYQSPGSVIGQFYDDSCVAACCRMLLCDDAGDVAEAVLRSALQTEQGAYLSAVPAVLWRFRLPGYVYRSRLALVELQTATEQRPALVTVKHRFDDVDTHALLVDRITSQSVFLRDPLPEGIGSAYCVSLETFLNVWLRDSGTGRAVIVG